MLIGIARLAREGHPLQQKARVEYRTLPTRQWLNRCSSPRMPFEWTINPYRGCEFGCQYCYARYTHEFMEFPDPLSFERLIFAKDFNPAAFRAELRRVKPGEWIAIGTATDPYQPAERRFLLTRRLLEVFSNRRGFNLALATKSDLAARDAPLFAQIARHNRVKVNLTVTTLDEGLARLLEPMAPRPSLRIAAAARLAQAGVEVGIMASPVLPGINDSEYNLDTVASAAARAGARAFSGQPVFLQPCAAQVFLPFLDAQFPHLARAYREHFARSAYIRGEYPERLKTLLAAIRERHGLAKFERWTPPDDQMTFSFPENSGYNPLTPSGGGSH
jgi:DNA repair photolyase